MAYLQHTEEDVRHMLETLGLEEIDDLFRSIPEEIRLRRPLEIPERHTETRLKRLFEALARRNHAGDAPPSFLGAGVYRHFIPAVVDYLSSRGEFNTAYTPYQPEVSQGTLQAIFEYQTMIARLTGMDLSNASMYDVGTALAEAALMAFGIHGKGRKILVADSLHPEALRVLRTYTDQHPVEVVSLPSGPDGRLDLERLREALDPEVFAVAIQNPNFFGGIESGSEIRKTIDAAIPDRPPLLISSVHPISLALLAAPGDYGADIAIGDGQSLGNPPNLGGPTFAFFATRQKHVRKIPGRIVGETLDSEGKRGFVLTFQTREQHIRRERATSNICTNQGLCCLRGAMTLAFLGEAGLRQIAELSVRLAHLGRERLLRVPGVRAISTGPFFNEFALELRRPADEVYRELGDRGIQGGLALGRYFPDRDHEMLFSFTDQNTPEEVELLARELESVLADSPADPDASPGRLGRAPERPRTR